MGAVGGSVETVIGLEAGLLNQILGRMTLPR